MIDETDEPRTSLEAHLFDDQINVQSAELMIARVSLLQVVRLVSIA